MFGTSFTINGVDVTAIYHAGRRIKITDTAATLYGTIASSSFSTNTTVTVTWDSGSLTSGALNNVYIGALSKHQMILYQQEYLLKKLQMELVCRYRVSTFKWCI